MTDEDDDRWQGTSMEDATEKALSLKERADVDNRGT